MEEGRESWGTRVGFILAAVGSAVGLGNIWRFPYLTAKNGGAGFVFFYIFLLILIGIPVMIAEFILGRSSRRSPVQALSQAGENNWGGLGYLFVLTGFGILSYYSVVAGWAIKYTLDALGGILMQSDPQKYFESINTGGEAVFYHLLFMAVTTGIVLSGVKKGIERSVKLLIPLLVVLIAGLAIWAFSQPGSLAGYAFYLSPDFDVFINTYQVNIFGLSEFSLTFLNLSLLASAAGQTFFTLSLGMGAMITYSSYLSSDEDLIHESMIISFSNFGISFLSGLMIFPIIKAFNLSEAISESTLGTLFITIPKAFQQLGNFYWSSALSFIFFVCLMLAALTSAVSLLEVVTSTLMDEINVKRKPAAAGSGLAIFLAGIPAAISMKWLAKADQIAGHFLLMLGGFLMAIYVGWIMKGAFKELKKGLKTEEAILPWTILIRYIVPPALLALLCTFTWEISLELWALIGG